MKTVTGLLPITIGVVLVGVLTWYLLQRGMTVGTWLLAAVLFGHGWVHLVFAFPSPAPEERTGGMDYPFDMSQSWLIGRGLEEGTVRSVGLVLMALTFLGFTLAALSTLGWLVPGGWWPGLVIGSALVSTVMLVLFYSPSLVLGFVINAALLWLVVQGPTESVVSR